MNTIAPMSKQNKPAPTMLPVSGRLPEDVYNWLAAQQIEGAVTMSDKMRVAITAFKRMQDGDAEYMEALAMQRDMAGSVRMQIAELEQQTQRYSGVLDALLDHVPPLSATVQAAQVGSETEACQLEAQLVRRAMLLCEALLRQGLTYQASAYDPAVVRQFAGPVLELAQVIATHKRETAAKTESSSP